MKGLLYLSLIILIATILPLAGCNGSSEEVFKGYQLPPEREEGTKVELVIHETYTDEEHQVFQSIVDIFNEDNPDITVKVERIPKGAQWSRLTQALATKETPDIARVEMEYIATLADRGTILPMELFWAEDHKETLVEGAILSNTYNKRVWGIPDQIYTSALFYNVRLLEESGSDIPDSNWSWEDLMQLARKVSDRNPDVIGLSYGSSLWELSPYIGSYGGTIYNSENKRIEIDSPEVVKALNLLYGYQLDVEGWTGSPIQSFINKDAAMVILDSNSIPKIEDSGIRFGVTKLPHGPAGSVSNIDGTSMVIFKDTEHPREAYEFLKFLTSSKIQALWADELGQLPVNKDSFKNVDVNKHPYLEIFMEQVSNVIPKPALPNYSQMEELFNMEMQKVFKGEKRLEHVLMDITAELNGEKQED